MENGLKLEIIFRDVYFLYCVNQVDEIFIDDEQVIQFSQRIGFLYN